MFCKYCGAQIADQAEICPKCGLRVEEKRKTSEVDAPNIGFAILGFFFPVVGFVLYLVWLQELPLKAKILRERRVDQRDRQRGARSTLHHYFCNFIRIRCCGGSTSRTDLISEKTS